MEKRDKDALEPRGALLDPFAVGRTFHLTRHAPGPALAPFVRHYWFIRWDLRRSPQHRQGTLTVPAANVVIEGAEDSVSGVWTRRFERMLEGEGAVFGALFRPVGFQPFWRRSMHLLTNRTVPVSEVFSTDPRALREGGDDAAMVEAYEAWLSAEKPRFEPEAAEVGAWVDLVESEPQIGKAEALAERVGVTLRTLQRALRYHVGVGPKQLIRRFRLLDASHALSRGDDLDLASLALRLGYVDQAHFARDFADVVGRPPGQYRRDQLSSR